MTNSNFLLLISRLATAALLFSATAFASEGIITRGIIKDLSSVDPLAIGIINGAEVSRLSFALGRLSSEDRNVLRSLKVNGDSYQFTLSSGVECLVQGKDLQAGQWRPLPINVADEPVPVGNGRLGNRPLLLRPCFTP